VRHKNLDFLFHFWWPVSSKLHRCVFKKVFGRGGSGTGWQPSWEEACLWTFFSARPAFIALLFSAFRLLCQQTLKFTFIFLFLLHHDSRLCFITYRVISINFSREMRQQQQTLSSTTWAVYRSLNLKSKIKRKTRNRNSAYVTAAITPRCKS